MTLHKKGTGCATCDAGLIGMHRHVSVDAATRKAKRTPPVDRIAEMLARIDKRSSDAHPKKRG